MMTSFTHVTTTTCNDDIIHSRYVVEVESLWQLEIQLNGGTLVRTLQGVHDHNVDLGGREGGRLDALPWQYPPF